MIQCDLIPPQDQKHAVLFYPAAESLVCYAALCQCGLVLKDFFYFYFFLLSPMVVNFQKWTHECDL